MGHDGYKLARKISKISLARISYLSYSENEVGLALFMWLETECLCFMLPPWPEQDLLGPYATFQESCNEIKADRSNGSDSQFPLGIFSVYESQTQKTGLCFYFFFLSLFYSGMYSDLWGIVNLDISCFPSCLCLGKVCKIRTVPSKASE